MQHSLQRSSCCLALVNLSVAVLARAFNAARRHTSRQSAVLLSQGNDVAFGSELAGSVPAVCCKRLMQQPRTQFFGGGR
jgi:hypothetical protein